MNGLNISLGRGKISKGGLKWSSFFILSAVLITSGFFVPSANATITTLNLTSPNGGEYWRGIQYITWSGLSDNSSDTIDIAYAADGVNFTQIIVANILFSNLSYPWDTLIPLISDTSTARIRITPSAFPLLDDSAAVFTIDNTAPVFTVSQGADIGPVKTDIINILVDDITSEVITKEYGFSTDAVCDGTDTYGNAFFSGIDFSIAGDHIDFLCLKATDTAGNTGFALVGQLNTDNTVPTVVLDYSADPAKAGEMTITATYSESIVGIPQVSIDQLGTTDVGPVSMIVIGTNNKVWTYAYTVNTATGDTYIDGEATVSLSAVVDAAGNTADVPTNTTFVIDTTAPTSSITLPIANAVVKNISGNVSLVFDSTGGSVCEYEINDNGNYLPLDSCTSPQIITLADGRNSIVLRVIDEAGNPTESTAVSFVVDTDNTLTVDDDASADFTTIQEAINAATAGDTISVLGGIYEESVIVDEELSIIGAGDVTIIQPALDQNGFTVTADNVMIQDLKIILTTSGNDAQAIRLEGANSVTISGNTIETTGDKGIGIWIGGIGYANSNNLRIIGNSITINGASTGIYAEGGTIAQTGWIIGGSVEDGNDITMATSNTLELYDVTDSEVSYNAFTITNAVDASNVMWFSELSNLSNLVFKNNIISGSTGSEVAIGTDFRNDGPFAGAQATSITTVTITGNTFNNWGSRALRLGKVGSGTLTGAIVHNNKFLDTGEALNNFDASEVNAEYNWWGTAVVATIDSITPGLVDFNPYWVNEDMNVLSTDDVLEVQVDDGWNDGDTMPANFYFGYNAFNTIQEGIDAIDVSGSTINVAAGMYTEQVTINKSLDLLGAGETTTTILAPAVRAGSVTQGTTVHDYILAAYATSGTIDVRVEGFTIDADSQNKTAGTARIDGVFFRDIKDIGGTMAGLFASTIYNFAATPDYESWGVAAYGDLLLTLDDNDVSDYTRDGILVIGGNVTISGNTVTGSATPLNGISVQDVTTGSIVGNTVTGHTRNLPWAGGGIVVWSSSGVSITSNHVNDNFYGIDLEPDTYDITISGNELISNIKRAISLNGADNNTVSGNTITGPIDGTDDTAIGLANTSTGNTIGGNDPIDGNIITMATAGTGNLYAIYMQSDVGVGSNTIKYNTITGGKRAVQFDGPPGITGLTTVANNTISGQEFGGIMAYNNGDLIISDNTLTNSVRPIEFFGPVNVDITDNTISGSTYAGINLGNFSGIATVSGNTIHGIVDNNGIWAQTSGAGLSITGNNIIYDISGTEGAGRGIQINAAADNVNIDGNEIYNITGFAGIVIDTGATGAKINNNHIHNNEQGIVANEQTAEFNNNRILNNRWGIDLNSTGATFILLNNNISNNNTNLDSYGLSVWAGTAKAEFNWWGDATGPYHVTLNPNGAGNSVSDNVDFNPFYTDEEFTEEGLRSSGPINYIDLGLNPESATINTNADLTITAFDDGYIVINDTATKFTLSADGGASFGANLITLTADGTTGTTITNDKTGIVNVTAVLVNSSITAANQIEFTKSDIVAPVISGQTPINGAINIPVSVVPTITFSKPLNSTTVSSATIQLKKADGTLVNSTVALVEGGTRVTITPDSTLENNTQYYLAVTIGVTDLSGNHLASAWDTSVSPFTTVAIQPIVTDKLEQVNNSPIADDLYLHGWHHVFEITVNTNETNLFVKAEDWVNSADPSLKVLASGNMRLLFNPSTGNGLGSVVGLTDEDIKNGLSPIISIPINNEYGVVGINVDGLDISTNPGRQIKFDIFTKIPMGTAAGFYNTKFGINVK